AEKVHGELLFFDGIGPFLPGARSVENLQAVFIEPFGKFDVVRMILVSESKRGESPCVFYIWVDRKAVVFFGQRVAVREDFNGARKIVRDGVLDLLAPARSAGRKTTAGGEVNRGHVKARIETAAAIEANFLRIGFIEIVKDAADGKTF